MNFALKRKVPFFACCSFGKVCTKTGRVWKNPVEHLNRDLQDHYWFKLFTETLDVYHQTFNSFLFGWWLILCVCVFSLLASSRPAASISLRFQREWTVWARWATPLCAVRTSIAPRSTWTDAGSAVTLPCWFSWTLCSIPVQEERPSLCLLLRNQRQVQGMTWWPLASVILIPCQWATTTSFSSNK